ncbi:GHKL domain-containing protein [Paenibacillus sp. IHBB 10380]|uniref:GHKL domain-containing protein n=1 Tax=Paenibacillus sp. IHBB 10380 TaxID=1566358 RepID=UPI0005CFDD81|nr:GHKL domain-containing protein [Paenibacillus sp. IHBB 10380]AJS59618.1 histidine kinase [Paenibacillus sp. IHBB 10380]
MKLNSFYSKKRIVYFIVVSCIVLSALMSVKLFISYYSTGKSAQITLAKQYIEIAKSIAVGLDKDVYQKFLLSKQEDENHKQTKRYIEQYHDRINALYVYILMLDDTDISKVMVSAIPAGVEEMTIGMPCTVPVTQVRQAKNGESYFTDIIKGGHNDSYLSVGVPFYSDDGKILGVIAIDIDAKELEQISHQVLKSSFFIFVIDILFAILLLIVAFILNKWYKFRSKQDLKESEKMYISELERVIDAIKSSRHDMMNHLQVLNGLMDMQLHEKANGYLKQLTMETRIVEMSLCIKNPILIVLFRSKWEFAQSKSIQMYFETDQNEYTRVDSMDLARIYSNLLDNAIEATEAYLGDQPKQIRVICKTIGEKYVFAVENTAQLTANEQKRLFQNGYTTKKNRDALRGNGLMIIKRTVEIYKGDIYFQYEKDKVFIRITL